MLSILCAPWYDLVATEGAQVHIRDIQCIERPSAVGDR